MPTLDVDLILLCSDKFPDDGTPVPKLVGILYLFLNAFFECISWLMC
jgi:hypothetical protein